MEIIEKDVEAIEVYNVLYKIKDTIIGIEKDRVEPNQNAI